MIYIGCVSSGINLSGFGLVRTETLFLMSGVLFKVILVVNHSVGRLG